MTVVALSSVKDAGVASGAFHMYADAQTLDVLQTTPVDRLVMRLFQWDKPTVSFGYLLDTEKVKAWTLEHGLSSIDVVKRPTGGGAVLHSTSDLSFSLAWRRDQKFFSDRPRDCYAEIHDRILKALSLHNGTAPTLYSPSSNPCSPPQRGGDRGGVCEAAPGVSPTLIPSPDGEGDKNFGEGNENLETGNKDKNPKQNSPVPVCFNEPVCNDVMLDGKKVIGGALRITKNAVLYQGTIQLAAMSTADLKDAVRRAFA
jgi:lipoate-protein ligase A